MSSKNEDPIAGTSLTTVAERVGRMSLVEAANDAHLLLMKLDPANKITQRLGKVLNREGSDVAPASARKAASA
jgi:hypothetical protein